MRFAEGEADRVSDEESSVWLTVAGWELGAEDLPATTRLVFGNGGDRLRPG
jgi:hypothetical protein